MSENKDNKWIVADPGWTLCKNCKVWHQNGFNHTCGINIPVERNGIELSLERIATALEAIAKSIEGGW